MVDSQLIDDDIQEHQIIIEDSIHPWYHHNHQPTGLIGQPSVCQKVCTAGDFQKSLRSPVVGC